MKLIMEDMRCFAGRHEIPIRPLTLLVGDNSSGKTTVLAATAAVLDPIGFPGAPRFNQAPYSLGSFDTIATGQPARSEPAEQFSLGLEERNVQIVAAFRAVRGQPSVVSLTMTLQTAGKRTDVTIFKREDQLVVAADGIERQITIPVGFGAKPLLGTLLLLEYLPMYLQAVLRDWPSDGPGVEGPRSVLISALHTWSGGRMLRSIAPVRTQPRRTYDEFTEEFSPEGAHIPLVLRSSRHDQTFHHELKVFGKESGLFGDVVVKELGERPGDPVQLMVQAGGSEVNLIDVGYGVSQALPLVAELLRIERATVLVQQPEVHLHPRAQAALGSFLVRAVAQQRHTLLVETHSDYIVDRVRMEIARGAIGPEDVALLWFDRRNAATTVHRIQIDEHGNIVEPPDGYRDFFLHEELALLTRTSPSA